MNAVHVYVYMKILYKHIIHACYINMHVISTCVYVYIYIYTYVI